MIIYVIHHDRLFILTLPKNINGSYTVTDLDNNRKDRTLIHVSEENGKWVAYSNKHVKIWQNQKVFEKIILENYQYLLLQIKGEEGFLVLFTCPVNDHFIGVTLNKDMQFTIGSGSDNAICCNNPLIGHKHAKISYQQGIWMLENLNSDYGTFVNNQLVSKECNLFHGDVIFILGFKLIVMGNQLYFNNPMNSVHYNKNIFNELIPREKLSITHRDEEENEIKLYEENDYFVRSPRFMETVEEEEFKVDPHPSIQEPESTPLILTMGPMLTMGTTSMVMLFVAFNSYQSNNRNLVSILPTIAMSFSMLAGTLLWPTLNRKYSKKQQAKKKGQIEEKYSSYLAKKETELIEISNRQKQILLSNNISPLECYRLIINHSKNLWMRELHQKDFLTLRLGVGKIPIKLKFSYPEEHFQLDDDILDAKMRQILERHKFIEGVPITLSFIEKNIVAITGKYNFIKNYMDILILQMITFHSYYDLKIVLLTENAKIDGWSYLKQMPHLFRNDKQMRFFATNFDEGKEITQYLQSVFTSRLENFKENDEQYDKYKGFAPYYVIVTDDYENVKDYPFIDQLLSQHSNLGFSLIIMHPTLANLPTECKAFIGINDLDKGGIFESELKKETQNSFQIDLLNQIDLNNCSLILNNIPIENKDESYNLPKTIGFLELFEVGNVEQLNSLERWKMNDPINSLATPIGLSMNGNLFKLDLHEKEQGPHGLIAGMTGSGKSEFIISFILSMAVNYHPYEVQFVLIDYKGGGLVGAFENKETGVSLPHLAGTITNLDTAEINRALASIESELKRRQSLFNQAREKLNEGTIDIYKYQKYYREGLLDIPLSHLFIISDEFAELKSQQPEFMDQLISTARIGRSLGVHLILATQKPSGIVNDQIWSNSRFKVCLKVQDAGDSNEVIKRPDAASLKDVGRFYLQVGYNEFFALGQAAYAGVSYIPQDRVYHEIDDKINFINNIGKSFKSVDFPKNSNLQIQGEELPNIVQYLNKLAIQEQIQVKQLWLEKLPNILYIDDIRKRYSFHKKNFEIEAILGLYDNPKLQTQGLLTLDLSHKGNTVIYSMNEKNTIINTIIYSLITTYHTKEVNIYVMDFDSQTLKVYKNAPQVGDVIFNNETEKIDNLFKMLTDEIERRKNLFQDYNGSYEFYCKNSGNTVPNIVFILYGYENFKEEFEAKETMLSKISREGFKYGIYVILTAISDRSLRLSMRSNFPQIIPLKLSSPIEYNMLLGKKAPMICDIEGRGMALVNDDVYEFQTAMICDSEQQNIYLKNVIDSLNHQIEQKAPSVRVLPEHVTWMDIEFMPIRLTQIPIGLEVDTLDISYYDLTKSLIHLISASDVSSLTNFSTTLIQKLSTVSEFETIVCDEKNYFSDTNGIIKKSFSDMHNILFSTERTKPTVVFVTGVEKWISTIPAEIKNDFANYLSKLQNLHNCFFVFIDRLEDIKSLNYEKWFKQYVSVDTSIFVGRGLNNSTIHNLVTPLRTLSVLIPDNYGYNIKNGIATRIKVVEGEDFNGE
ncbi:MAG: type VII secretion protein EssC [Erysipelotrichaceae bacterium]|nr:type VII secretion protein EssC [Erysipelotrichaceae bacterium]